MMLKKIRNIGVMIMVLTMCISTAYTKDQKPIVLKGKLKNYKEKQLTFQYQPYSVFSSLKTETAEVKEDGSFQVEIDTESAIRGFFSLGKIAVTEKFTFTTVQGADSARSSSTFDSRLIYVYLKPGENLYVSVDADDYRETLVFEGESAENSYFMNEEDRVLNQYKDRFIKNYYSIVAYEPNAFLKLVDDRTEEQLQFLAKTKYKISPQLREIFKWKYLGEQVTRKLYYPSSRESYVGQKPVLPEDYFEFVNKVKLPDESAHLGPGYFYFLAAYLHKKHEMSGSAKNYYNYVATIMEEKPLYEYYAFALRRDFKKTLYDKFDESCPYPELANRVKQEYQHLEGMLAGNPAPDVTLTDLEGNKAPLSSYKGSYVYIDFWATWCGPCIKEIPSLKALEKEYHGKNIKFLSISVDDNEDVDKWKSFVDRRNLTGNQLWVDESNYAIFKKAFNIVEIPRFVIIDPKGRIVDANALRPSNERIKTVFDNLEGI